MKRKDEMTYLPLAYQNIRLPIHSPPSSIQWPTWQMVQAG